MQINWVYVIMAGLAWLYPWFVINFILLTIFWKNRKLLKTNWKNIKLVWRETLGEKRYLIPLYNWRLMASLVNGKIIIDGYLKSKLLKLNK